MAVTPDTIYRYSQSLLENNTSEIELRASVKNAYYSAYHEVRNVLNSPIPEYHGMGSHLGFITYLGEEAFRYEIGVEKNTLRRLAIILNRMKSERHTVDYVLEADIPIERAKQCSINATLIFELCSSIRESRAA
jgi:uncharacterized protein (UPF0332 family)